MLLEALVIEVISEAILSNPKLTYAQLTGLVEDHPLYKGKSRGKSLERRIRNILRDERVLEQLPEISEFRESIPDENNISLGFKLGRLEVKGKLRLD